MANPTIAIIGVNQILSTIIIVYLHLASLS
jgi:hypothetical protein